MLLINVSSINFALGSEERKRITNRLVADTIGVYSSDAIGKPCN
jgi:hypothetical protein